MFKFSISPEWFISSKKGEPISLPAVIGLLTEIDRSGNLVAACKTHNLSYRHGWGILRKFEEEFGVPLLITSRRLGTQLTPFAQKLIWANRRIQARLGPTLESLASELEREIESAISTPENVLRIHASHGFAVAALIKRLEATTHPIEFKYEGSADALNSLSKGSCDAAGFHIPIGPLRETVIKQYSKFLKPKEQIIVPLAIRTQGIITAPGNPKNIQTVNDFVRRDVSIVNRQPHSGTRTLLDLLLKDQKIDVTNIRGYENSEFTHAAVAAYIASGMADAGFGIETGARQFGLDFVPVATENYYMIFNKNSGSHLAIQEMIGTMQDQLFRNEINQIAGYVCDRPAEAISAAKELELK
ncbi:substrate-binding domain-containing protein [Polynucleobacter sphagniphilus]|jgi:molybdate transport repressor ModE-like protein|uniref:Molybdate transport repressor ModE-like protein n=1 Tax=Polynucleobacter sphagniphilus TaxID=1743169 RepID=A0AA43MAI2_9BURK|nr:substrate-binding domain-containing protein [Polynucleobacter sphagniphilus]MDH6504227.1 molybdate transport repressor ModE-like protein [Polynucleobacter sphagniphilus]MDH6512215.1 molybdate transport repressor ModE-like protein [Polynucleobacter sphagniphilus]